MEQPNITERVERLEKNVEYLLSLAQPKREIEVLVQEDVTENETQRRGFDAQVASCSDLAKTSKPSPLSRQFRPSKVGFTPDAFKTMFPHLSPNETLEKFLTFYISRGDVAVNWFEKFLAYAAEGERRALLAKAEHRVETDSMGLPLDPKLRRRMSGATEDPDAAQRMRELKTKQDEIYESLTDEEKEMLK